MKSRLYWLACSLTLLAGSLFAQEIGYIETFGLAGDRDAALSRHAFQPRQRRTHAGCVRTHHVTLERWSRRGFQKKWRSRLEL